MDQPEPGRETEIVVSMVETNFVLETSQEPVSREQFMMLLSNVHMLLIRATYYSATQEAR